MREIIVISDRNAGKTFATKMFNLSVWARKAAKSFEDFNRTLETLKTATATMRITFDKPNHLVVRRLSKFLRQQTKLRAKMRWNKKRRSR